MLRSFSLRTALLGTFGGLLLPALLSAQLPARLKRCLPYPTFADEISQTTEQEAPSPEPLTVLVDSIQLIGGDTLPEAVRQQLLNPIFPGGAFGEDWPRGFAEVGARGILQDAGYFRAVVSAEGQVLTTDVTSQHVAIPLHVEEGPRYRLSSVNFRSATETEPLAFDFETLRQQIALVEGDLFDVSKIRRGIERITGLYRPLGHVDLTVEPQTDIDDETQTIAITFIVDQGLQYRISKVEVWGPNPETEKVLQSKWPVGGVFNADYMDAFFKENKSILPPDVSPEHDVQVSRNTKDGTVDLKFDFRVCPRPQT